MMAVNANDPMTERIVQLFWEHLRGNLFARPLPEDPDACARLRERLENLSAFPFAARFPAGTLPTGAYALAQSFLGMEQLHLGWERGQLLLRGRSEIRLPLDGSWTACEVPFLFTEMAGRREHRKFEHGLRLDTHVGYPAEQGYAAGAWQENGSLALVFRSDAWMGSHIVTIKAFDGGLTLTHENGASWRLRSRPGAGGWIVIRGYGQASRMEQDLGDSWYDVWAQDACDFADAMGIKAFCYTGVSHGAGIGWHICINHPERVKAFFCIVGGTSRQGWPGDRLRAAGGHRCRRYPGELTGIL